MLRRTHGCRNQLKCPAKRNDLKLSCFAQQTKEWRSSVLTPPFLSSALFDSPLLLGPTDRQLTAFWKKTKKITTEIFAVVKLLLFLLFHSFLCFLDNIILLFLKNRVALPKKNIQQILEETKGGWPGKSDCYKNDAHAKKVPPPGANGTHPPWKTF